MSDTNGLTPYAKKTIRTNGVDGSIIELLPSAAYSAEFVPKSHVIGFAFEPQLGVHKIGSDKRQDFYRQAHSFAFIPSGCDVFSESALGGEYLSLSLAPEWLNEIDHQTPISQLLSAESIQTARALRKQLISQQLMNPSLPVSTSSLEYYSKNAAINKIDNTKHIDHTLLEKLAIDITQQLTTHHQSKHYVLSQRQMRTIDEFINDALNSTIEHTLSVLDMAKLLNISAGHFARLFKLSTGVSPFDYVIQHRLQYARQRLSHSTDNLSSIAFASGFSSHSHMSMAFKKHLGCSPISLRDIERHCAIIAYNKT